MLPRGGEAAFLSISTTFSLSGPSLTQSKGVLPQAQIEIRLWRSNG